MTAKQTVFNIPAGQPFAKCLAAQILEQYKQAPEILPNIRVLLPTRRACRIVSDSFLQISGGKAMFLPKIQTIGDVDEEELSLLIAGQNGMQAFLDIPPAIPGLKRDLLLAQLIAGRPDFTQGFDHALTLAKALARFMDQIHTENLQLLDLHKIVPEEFAEHWKITLTFLDILAQNWPKILKSHGYLDAADRRNRLLLALASYWHQNPPDTPIIAAGSTGSIPAVASLFSTITTLPKGCVVLPGVDTAMDEDTWITMEETHPQYGFKHLFDHMGFHRQDIQPWPHETDHPICASRRLLAKEFMRPAETTQHWTKLQTEIQPTKTFTQALENLEYYTCEHADEEAMCIALIMRETLETPHKTAALITPDRDLAKRVQNICLRWGIHLDDSAGQSLIETRSGLFTLLCLKALENNENLKPSALLATLKHTFCRFSVQSVQQIKSLEISCFRNQKPAKTFEKIRKNFAPTLDEETLLFLENIEHCFAPLTALGNAKHPVRVFLQAHIKTLENLSQEDKLWAREDGESSSNLFSELIEYADLMPDMDRQTYGQIIEKLLRMTTIRPRYGMHPRLMILGQLEARLINADRLILAGLNEGTWPSDIHYDPWMSAPMRETFGLPAHERNIGLAAHDFVQGFCHINVTLTRAQKNNGIETVPARWLQRLETVLESCQINPESLSCGPYKQWTKALGQGTSPQPCTRPEPRPPAEKRPRQLAATKIDTWLRDPYGIYARYILKLRKIEPLERQTDAAQRGTILHETLEKFITLHKNNIPAMSTQILKDMAQETLQTYDHSSEDWLFWWPRFDKIANAFLEHETKWRENGAKPLKTEIHGKTEIHVPGGRFIISAIADRIDQLNNGIAIIDYKTGGTYSQTKIKSGELSQLPIEAFILQAGGFQTIHNETTPAYVGYWVLGASGTPLKITALSDNLLELCEKTRKNLEDLIIQFDDPEVPYYNLPMPSRAARFNDYEHLARIKEWAALDEDENGSEAA